MPTPRPENPFAFDAQPTPAENANGDGQFDALQGLDDVQVESLLPSFFENIMVPYSDFAGPQMAELPPDISTIMPEQDDWLANLDLFGGDFAPNFDFAMENGAGPAEEATPMVSVTGAESAASGNRSTATVRSTIFQQSPQ